MGSTPGSDPSVHSLPPSNPVQFNQPKEGPRTATPHARGWHDRTPARGLFPGMVSFGRNPCCRKAPRAPTNNTPTFPHHPNDPQHPTPNPDEKGSLQRGTISEQLPATAPKQGAKFRCCMAGPRHYERRQKMTVCKRDPGHVYPPHNTACPWCKIASTHSEAANHRTPQSPNAKPSPFEEVISGDASRSKRNHLSTTSPASSSRSPKTERIPLRTTVSEFGQFALVLAGLWLFTPVVASFGTLVLGDRLMNVVFMNGETGSTAGDGPGTLYGMLGRAVVAVWLVCLIARLLVQRKSNRYDPFSVGCAGASVGLLCFMYQLYQESLKPESWYLVPFGFAVGYVLAACLTWWDARRRALGPRVAG